MAPIPNVKTAFANGSGPGAGFDRVGWAPEGETYFNYSVNAPATVDSFLAASHADIDNDADPQYWGYAKDDPAGGSVDGKSHGGLGTCLRASLTEETVMPCTADSGNSVFYKDESGAIFHTYSNYARGGEDFLGIYRILEITPRGRNEHGPYYSLTDWARPHDMYGKGGEVAPNGRFTPPVSCCM